MGNKKLRKAAADALGTLEAIELYGTDSLKPGVLKKSIDNLLSALKEKVVSQKQKEG